MDALRALEKATLDIAPGELEEICRRENWEVGQNLCVFKLLVDELPGNFCSAIYSILHRAISSNKPSTERHLLDYHEMPSGWIRW